MKRQRQKYMPSIISIVAMIGVSCFMFLTTFMCFLNVTKDGDGLSFHLCAKTASIILMFMGSFLSSIITMLLIGLRFNSKKEVA